MSKSFEYFFNLITQAVHLNEQEEWLRKNCLTYSVRRFRSFVLIHTYVLTIVSQTLYFWTNCYWKIRLNFLLAACYFLVIAYYFLLIPCLLIKNNTFISNTKLKLAKIKQKLSNTPRLNFDWKTTKCVKSSHPVLMRLYD